MNFNEYIEKPISHKAVLAWIEPSYRLQGWTVYSGSVYQVDAPEFIVGLSRNGTTLNQVNSIPTSDGEFYYSPTDGIVYLFSSTNPNQEKVRADFRLFFSSGPFILPYDLSAGTSVEYQSLINETSQFGYEFDSEQLGVMLEGQGSISLQNNHGYFDDIWEKYFWENKPAYIYSWSPSIPVTEAKIIYKGFIKGKSFSSNEVSFSLTDFISKLKDPVPLNQFSDSDGIIPDSVIGSYKRRIYGRVDGLKCLSLDQTLDGYELTGTVTGATGTQTLTGVGTQFLSELSPEDDIIFEEDRYKIETITSDTVATVSRTIEESISGTIKVIPEVPYRRKNRLWHVAGHPLKVIKSYITSIVSLNRFEVDTIENLVAGDTVVINGDTVVIRRISGNVIVLMSNLPVAPSIGDYFYRYPVQGVNVGTTDFVLFRDYQLTNTPEAILELDELAEFNATQEFPFAGTATFTNGSRVVTGSGTSFDTDFKTRDWIRINTDATWYEILSVESQTQLTLRSPFTGSTGSYSGLKKNPTYIDEESILTVNCYGKSDDGTEDGQWIKTTGDVVKDLLADQGLTALIDTASFAEANLRAPELVSFRLPLNFGSNQPITTIDAINLMTTTSLGALYSNQDFNIAYSIVSAKKPPELTVISDHDIIDFTVENDATNISREIIGLYRHRDADRYTGEEATSTKSYVNEVVDLFMDTKKTKSIDLYLYNEDEAYTWVRRYALVYESGTTRIQIKTKLNLSRKNIGDKIYLQLDRLYKRFASDGSRRKISMVTGVRKDGFNTIVTLDDFGGIFTKVATFAADGSNVYDLAEDDEKVRNGYYTSDSTELSDSKLTYRINLFG